MKIATWNVNSIRTRQSHVVNWLKQQPVDILCLQETKVIDPDFPRNAFTELGYQVHVSGQKAYNGVAILTKIPPKEVKTGFTPILGAEKIEDMDSQKRLIAGLVNDIWVVNVYVPNGAAVNDPKYEYKLKWLQLLQGYLQELSIQSAKGICLCGDFNIAPEDKDIYKNIAQPDHIMCSPPERQALAAIQEIGFQDALRQVNQEGGLFTWWDYRASGFSRNRGWRIDHIYFNELVSPQINSCFIDIEPRKQEKPSDHAPVIASLSL
ncbi:MAG: exodeoxyribonuclease III [Gloeocapsa sp. DLM2.Bin57]|nr:MAG: exodeoxyribonuclease III [Gloeocapsa sp. DLM2.Bin57]